MLIELSLSRAQRSSLQDQLVDQISAHVRSGRLLPGAALPSSRELAGQLGIARNTVTHAYERLIDEGYLETAIGVGTRVAKLIPDDCQYVDGSQPGRSPSGDVAPRAPVVFRGASLAIPSRPRAKPAIDFWPGRPNREHFPLATWRRIADDVLVTASAKLVEYGDPMGLPELREGIARHLSTTRGLQCTAESILVTAGTQEALNLLARMFVENGTGVVIENPGYGSAAETFASYGAHLIPVPVDAEGIDVARLPSAGARLAYVTPSHQFPTGALLSSDRRQALLEWSNRTGAYIVEDDYDCDVNYSGRPQLALAGTQPGAPVIYVGTLSKALGAGVRTGYIVVPPELLEAARATKTMMNFGHPWLDQAILAEFLRGETFQRHLRLIRKAYLGTLEHLTHCLTTELGPVEFWGRQSGMHVMWRLPAWIGSASTFKARLEDAGVYVHTLASGGAFDAGSCYGETSILLGYAALREDEVATAAKIMGKVARTGLTHQTRHLNMQQECRLR